MNNPLLLFYAKIYQYFNYAGIKLINLHVQASFLFSVTLYFYVIKMIDVLHLELNAIGTLALLVAGPVMQLVSYLYFSRNEVEGEIKNIFSKENEENKAVSNGLTIVFIIPMILFFVQFIVK